MRIIQILLLTLAPALSHAHCPYEVSSHGNDYCIDVAWDFGEKKIHGQFETTEAETPYLVKQGTVPQKWVYSALIVTTWMKGDSNHVPVEIPDFRVFPYMHMINGHHHSAGYEFFFDSANEYYVFRRVVFQQMQGCWSLRWTVDDQDTKDSSQILFNITEYANLAEAEVEEQVQLCEDSGDTDDGGAHGAHHNH